MQNEIEFPETLSDAIKYFADPDRALQFVASIRWADGKAICPVCKSTDAGFLSTRRLWKCRECGKQFSVKVGTIFEDSALGFDKWLPAFWMIVNAKNGISSYELHRSIGVTQKSAWFMLHRIRLAIQSGSIIKMSGEVEADETFIGGLSRNMSKGRRKRTITGTGGAGKAIVMGLLERSAEAKKSRVKLKHIANVRRATIHAEVRENVTTGTELFTDTYVSYEGLTQDYIHKAINHAECYAKGKVHTNGLENFWSLLKRSIKGTYVSVEPFHLFRYLDEQAFRFNERETDDAGRFLKGIVGVIGKRLQYAKLIGEQTSGGLPPSGTWQAA
jgi:transposase-like protein